MILLYKKTLILLLIFTSSAILQCSATSGNTTSSISSQYESPFAGLLHIRQASLSSQAYQEEQMRKIQEKIDREKAETSPK